MTGRRLSLAMLALLAAAPATRPTTAPGTVRLTDAKPLAELTPTGLEAEMTDVLSPPQVAEHAVYFGTVNAYAGTDDDADLTSALPIVATKDGDRWRAVPLVGKGLANAGWRYVGAGPRRGEVWAVLDTVVGDDAPTFTIAHSTNGGRTFALTAYDKPCPQASVYDFALARDGHGRVTLSLDTSVGHHHPGLYHYDTADGGRTWATAPRFEPDAMTRADSVPDDDQPDVPDRPDGKKTALRRPARVVVPIRMARPFSDGPEGRAENAVRRAEPGPPGRR